jgi:hypothetical protein
LCIVGGREKGERVEGGVRSVLMEARGLIGEEVDRLVRGGRVGVGWWERGVSGVVAELLLLCIGSVIAMQRGEVDTLRWLIELLQIKASHLNDQPMHSVITSILSTLHALLRRDPLS